MALFDENDAEGIILLRDVFFSTATGINHFDIRLVSSEQLL